MLLNALRRHPLVFRKRHKFSVQHLRTTACAAYNEDACLQFASEKGIPSNTNMPNQKLNYNNFVDLLEGDFLNFKQSRLYKFASKSKEIPYVYAGVFVEYITELMLKEPDNDEVKRFFMVINEAFQVNDSELENLIKIQFLDYWRVYAETKLDYILSQLTVASRLNFVSLLNYYKSPNRTPDKPQQWHPKFISNLLTLFPRHATVPAFPPPQRSAGVGTS